MLHSSATWRWREDNLIAANAAYAKDRASFYQTLASTLQHYGIKLPDAAKGVVTTEPVVTGIEPAKPGNEPTTTPPRRRTSPRHLHHQRSKAIPIPNFDGPGET